MILGRKSGFTLVELLVVCGIVGTLLSVFLPCVCIARGSALSLKCKHNLHLLGLGMSMFAQRRGKLPHGDRDSDTGPNNCWFDRIDEYLDVPNLHAVKQCPAWDGYVQPKTVDRHSLKMNGALCPKERLPETEEDRRLHHWYWPRPWCIPQKSRTVLLLDGRMDPPYDTHTDTKIDKPFHDTANRHLGGCNLLMVDGSVQYVDADALGISQGDIGWSNAGNFTWEAEATRRK